MDVIVMSASTLPGHTCGTTVAMAAPKKRARMAMKTICMVKNCSGQRGDVNSLFIRAGTDCPSECQMRSAFSITIGVTGTPCMPSRVATGVSSICTTTSIPDTTSPKTV